MLPRSLAENGEVDLVEVGDAQTRDCLFGRYFLANARKKRGRIFDLILHLRLLCLSRGNLLVLSLLSVR